MISLTVNLDGDGASKDLAERVIAEISAVLLIAGARLVETQAKKEGIVL